MLPIENWKISELTFACLVKEGQGTPIHQDRTSYGLVFQISGAKEYCFAESSIITDQRSLLFLPKHSRYSVRSKQKGDCYAFNFQIEGDPDLLPASFPFRRAADYDFFLSAFREATELWKNKNALSSLKLKSLLYDILYHCLPFDEAEELTGKYRILLPGVQYLRENFSLSDCSIALASEKCHISVGYFRRLFAERFSCSPMEWVIRRRIDYAKELLNSKIYAVQSVAILCGFSEECQFSRIFKKHCGVSPGKYRG